MSNAVCLNCGEMKFGAYNECESCKSGPMDIKIDCYITDHFLGDEEIKETCKAIKIIRATIPDSNIADLAVIHFLCKKIPNILSFESNLLDEDTLKIIEEHFDLFLENLSAPSKANRDTFPKKRFSLKKTLTKYFIEWRFLFALSVIGGIYNGFANDKGPLFLLTISAFTCAIIDFISKTSDGDSYYSKLNSTKYSLIYLFISCLQSFISMLGVFKIIVFLRDFFYWKF